LATKFKEIIMSEMSSVQKFAVGSVGAIKAAFIANPLLGIGVTVGAILIGGGIAFYTWNQGEASEQEMKEADQKAKDERVAKDKQVLDEAGDPEAGIAKMKAGEYQRDMEFLHDKVRSFVLMCGGFTNIDRFYIPTFPEKAVCIKLKQPIATPSNDQGKEVFDMLRVTEADQGLNLVISMMDSEYTQEEVYAIMYVMQSEYFSNLNREDVH
jgi:hypothetical protein